MTRIGLLAVALALVVAGCDSGAGAPRPAPGAGLSVALLGFDADGFASGQYAALSPAPINLGAFASWYARSDDADDFDEPSSVPALPAKPVYLAVSGATGCRTPTDVTVQRHGTDLKVEFVGGADHPECLRAVGPAAYFALPGDAVAGLRTVNGAPTVSPAGPGTVLDTVRLDSGPPGPVPPAELGTPGVTAMRDALASANASALAALAYQPKPGQRAFAFVIENCPEGNAVLLLNREHITAEANTDCKTPVPFLATFVVDTARVPETAVLG
jgi:hypothetical protein